MKVQTSAQNAKRQTRKRKNVVVGRGSYGIGSSIGSALGNMAENVIGKIFGSGAYDVKSNSLVGGQVPEFALSKGAAGNEFAHREFVSDIFSGPTLAGVATAFNLQQFQINPANHTLFPWLSQIALNYEEFELIGMIAEFIPSSGNAVSSTNAALGTVIFATQYNSLDQPFTTKRQMESYEFATSCVPSVKMVHPIECAKGENALNTMYVNNPGTQTGLGDPRFSIKGILNIATVGQQAANANLGELWVSTHVRFKRPRLAPAAECAHWKLSGAASVFAAFGNVITPDPVYTTILGVSVTSVAVPGNGYLLSWPASYPGQFLVNFTGENLVGPNWTFTNQFTVTPSGGVSQLQIFQGPSGPTANLNLFTVTVGTAVIGFETMILSDGTAGSLFIGNINSSSGYPTATASDIFITPLSTN